MKYLQTKSVVHLKKWNTICMAVAIVILALMVVIIALSLFRISEQNENTWMQALATSLLLPILFIPLLLVSSIQKELKKRKSTNS